MVARNRSPREPGAQAPYGLFMMRIIQAPNLPAQCRIRLGEYPAFREALHARLQARGLREEHIAAVLHGKLVGTCPACQMRLSLEYLDALCGAGDFAGPAGMARFAEGRCVNAACLSTDILLCWRP